MLIDTRRPCSTLCRTGGSPAHAGMDPSVPCPGVSSAGLPRTRGDGPFRMGTPCALLPVPPHTRGWTQASSDTSTRRAGSPAHAGMDPPNAGRTRRAARLPRTRGDGPEFPADKHGTIEAPPRCSRPCHRPDQDDGPAHDPERRPRGPAGLQRGTLGSQGTGRGRTISRPEAIATSGNTNSDPTDL